MLSPFQLQFSIIDSIQPADQTLSYMISAPLDKILSPLGLVALFARLAQLPQNISSLCNLCRMLKVVHYFKFYVL